MNTDECECGHIRTQHGRHRLGEYCRHFVCCDRVEDERDPGYEHDFVNHQVKRCPCKQFAKVCSPATGFCGKDNCAVCGPAPAAPADTSHWAVIRD